MSDARDLTRARNVATVRRLFELEVQKDLDAWCALWRNDGRQVFPTGDGSTDIIGLPALRASAEHKFATRADVSITTDVLAMADPDWVFASLNASMRLIGPEKTLTTLIWCRFRLDEDGKILEMQEMFDGEAIRRALSKETG